jgi:hypothetical protein
VVSVTDPYGRILGFLDRKRSPYIFLNNIKNPLCTAKEKSISREEPLIKYIAVPMW